MGMFDGINISGSALTANRFKMDVHADNIANQQTTRARLNEAGEWEPYRRKIVTQGAKGEQFNQLLHKAIGKQDISTGKGVSIHSVKEDPAPFEPVYNPNHPDANEEGYVMMPNVDPLKEMMGMMTASRAYEANVTALNASKGILMKSLEIGK
ncbi:flagellar basal body rod protein FlgC [Allobacillus halotolerans]|uniref:Flagellar basal-body rod protein FlgC n=1 Tax=Allobacillus halotolerans TaxID=570278 RepID=A0ABS6GPI2_9BACI|nr:flagellar basal body rod protein FlgC [Allobacillus halotolerans]MBU6081030.1 flagellar basal body rod protein FlgC [Allobacillus halotolerans]